MQKIRNTFSAGVAAAALIITAHAAQKVETPTMKNQTLPPIADDTRIFRLNPLWRLHIEGREAIDPRKAYVITVNH